MSFKFKLWLAALLLIAAWKVGIIIGPPEDLRAYNLSTIDTVTAYYPQWACGDCPDFMLLTMNKAENQAYALTDAYISPPAGFPLLESYYREFAAVKFTCIGKLKVKPAAFSHCCAGEELKVFYADYCERSPLTSADWELIEKFNDK